MALGLNLHLLGPLRVALLHRRLAYGNRNIALGNGFYCARSRTYSRENAMLSASFCAQHNKPGSFVNGYQDPRIDGGKRS